MQLKNSKNIQPYNFILMFVTMMLAIIFCYRYIDIILVDFLYVNQARKYDWLVLFAEIPPIIAGVVVLGIYVLALIYFLVSKMDKLNKWIHIANICSICIYLKDTSKTLFGRYFPDTWFCGNLSYIQDGAYGFCGMFTNLINSSFPSGHVTLITSFAMSTIYFYPKLCYALIPMIVLTILGQVILYYHFLSDVIASLLLVFIVKSIYLAYFNLKIK